MALPGARSAAGLRGAGKGGRRLCSSDTPGVGIRPRSYGRSAGILSRSSSIALVAWRRAMSLVAASIFGLL